MLEGTWQGKGVFNMEEFDPDTFMDELNKQGLPWKIMELGADESRESKVICLTASQKRV